MACGAAGGSREATAAAVSTAGGAAGAAAGDAVGCKRAAASGVVAAAAVVACKRVAASSKGDTIWGKQQAGVMPCCCACMVSCCSSGVLPCCGVEVLPCWASTSSGVLVGVVQCWGGGVLAAGVVMPAFAAAAAKELAVLGCVTAACCEGGAV